MGEMDQDLAAKHERGVRRVIGAVEEIVDFPEDVRIMVALHGQHIFVELETNPQDVGVVVGRAGHVVSSLRSLLSVYAGKHRMKMVFDYLTDIEQARPRGARDQQ